MVRNAFFAIGMVWSAAAGSNRLMQKLDERRASSPAGNNREYGGGGGNVSGDAAQGGGGGKAQRHRWYKECPPSEFNDGASDSACTDCTVLEWGSEGDDDTVLFDDGDGTASVELTPRFMQYQSETSRGSQIPGIRAALPPSRQPMICYTPPVEDDDEGLGGAAHGGPEGTRAGHGCGGHPVAVSGTSSKATTARERFCIATQRRTTVGVAASSQGTTAREGYRDRAERRVTARLAGVRMGQTVTKRPEILVVRGPGVVCSTATVEYHGVDWNFQWQRGTRLPPSKKDKQSSATFEDITDAVLSQYTLQLEDLGKVLRVRCQLKEAGSRAKYAYVNNSAFVTMDNVLGAIAKLTDLAVFKVATQDVVTGRVKGNCKLTISPDHLSIARRPGKRTQKQLYISWRQSFLLSPNETRALLIIHKAPAKLILDVKFQSPADRTLAFHIWHHFCSTALRRATAMGVAMPNLRSPVGQAWPGMQAPPAVAGKAGAMGLHSSTAYPGLNTANVSCAAMRQSYDPGMRLRPPRPTMEQAMEAQRQRHIHVFAARSSMQH